METLSDYMLLEVFLLLDVASLKNCTEVCKRWNNLISRSTSTMNKLTLMVDRSRSLRDLRHINRRYSNLKLFGTNVGPKTWSLLSNCQQNLRKLELSDIRISASDYEKTLRNIPTLQKLKIVYCSIPTRFGRGVASVKMPMLQKLTNNGSNKFLRIIDGSALKKLEYSDAELAKRSFISSLRDLEELSFVSLFNGTCERFASAKVQLKSLKISFWWIGSSCARRACSLVKAHASTLETLELKSGRHSRIITHYDLTNVAPFNSLSTQSFDEFYDLLVDVYSTNYSPQLNASTAKYYMPQLKSLKIFNPQTQRRHV